MFCLKSEHLNYCWQVPGELTNTYFLSINNCKKKTHQKKFKWWTKPIKKNKINSWTKTYWRITHKIWSVKIAKKKHIEKNLSDKQTYWKKNYWWTNIAKKSLNDEQTYWKITHENWSVKIVKKKHIEKHFKWQNKPIEKN